MKTKGIYFLYRVLQALALPALLFYFLFRGLSNRGYWRSLPQRFGFVPRPFRQTGPGAIWLHAVSVGEVLACLEFLRAVRAELPRSRIFVSTSTLAGRATAGQKLADLADGVFYAPVDYTFVIRRVLRALQPSVVVIAETEIWPNLFRETKRTGAALAMVNGRISDRAIPRYRRWRWFFRAVLPEADTILVQSDEIARRFIEIGAPAERVQTAGNFKYDFEARQPDARSPVVEWLGRLNPAQVWVAASTMTDGSIDEDDAVIQAYLEVRRPGLAMILAPRKPERFDSAAAKLEAAGIGYWRRSRAQSGATGGILQDRLETPPPVAPVLLLDTIGELAALFSTAGLVFMGGTLAERGGHNILEPAAFGKPVIVGPHMENFQAIADEFRAAGALIEIRAPGDLAAAVKRVMDDPEIARETGRRALACANASRGASARAAAAVRRLHGSRIAAYRPASPWFGIAWLLACVWRWGGKRRRERHLREQKRLDVPVISVGNLSMGGTGKTPCVLRLAELLRERGRHPGILTRGYKRNTPHQHLLLAPGAPASALQIGDEPLIFVRSALAPVGVGANRWETGMLLRQQFPVDTMLLDDGFQHLKLARDVDIVLLDALNPFAGGGLFPLGRLREPLEALSRADVIVITRARESDLPCAIESQVRRWNPRAPLFRAFVEPREWVEHRTGRTFPPEERPFEKAGVFCGLGNPQTFRLTLQQLGIQPVEWIDFEDHHRYRPQELRRIAHVLCSLGARSVITTQKDAVNLCDACDDLMNPLPLYWLRIGMEIERESEFLDEIMRRLS